MGYALLKSLHVATVGISFLLFLWRWLWVLQHDPAGRPRWMRWVPHVNDSLLFFLGLGLAWHLQQYPFVSPWLTAKLSALLIYILLGIYVMRFAPSARARLVGGVAALLVFAYMIGTAVHKQALWFLGG